MTFINRKKTKLAIIGSVGIPASYGGFETLAEHLVDNLSEDYAITIYCSGKKYKKEARLKTYKNAKLKYIPLDANGIQSIFYDCISIIHSLFYADVLLILGVPGAILLPFVRRFTKKKIIISIDGIEWKRAKWNLIAKWYLFWVEGLAVKYSHIDISDNESIQDYTALRYGSLSRVVEYGADHTIKVEPTEQDFIDYPFLKGKYAFKVCRIEPENNVHEVLKAFADLPDYNLVIVGNWSNSDYGLEFKEQFKDFPNIYLINPIYDQSKLDVLRGNAHVYVHGHSAGGTNPSLVEAMYLGLPIIAFSVSYNRVTTENKAWYFKNKSELKFIIESSTPEQLRFIGDSMLEIAKRRYNWKLIANKYKSLINESLRTKKKLKVYPRTKDISDEILLKMNLSHLKYQDTFVKKIKQ